MIHCLKFCFQTTENNHLDFGVQNETLKTKMNAINEFVGT